MGHHKSFEMLDEAFLKRFLHKAFLCFEVLGQLVVYNSGSCVFHISKSSAKDMFYVSNLRVCCVPISAIRRSAKNDNEKLETIKTTLERHNRQGLNSLGNFLPVPPGGVAHMGR